MRRTNARVLVMVQHRFDAQHDVIEIASAEMGTAVVVWLIEVQGTALTWAHVRVVPASCVPGRQRPLGRVGQG
jgi:hypothetical protein